MIQIRVLCICLLLIGFKSGFAQKTLFDQMPRSPIDSKKYFKVIQLTSGADYAFITESLRIEYGKDSR
ncbi:MAG: hypothetical protein JW801_02600 [Bacteroidales bacterium]|nr:hypothetical protein [Bacteroidales bacterium]